jgi:uncharacterized membrane protein YdjX (TVP38/TMEM64 family)
MRTQAIKLFIAIFFCSILYATSIDFPGIATSYDKGLVVGTFFGQAIKLIGITGLILFGIQRYAKLRSIQ